MARMPRIWDDPFGLTSNISKLLDNVDSDLGFTAGYGRTDIFEKDGRLNYHIELPGLKKEDIEARIEDNRLIIKGEIKREQEVEEDDFFRMERRYGNFQKSFVLPEEAEDTQNLEARFEDGILKISLPLKESIRGDVIDIDIE